MDSIQLLIGKLQQIQQMGWIKNQRPGNVGGVGNTLEDLVGVSENNLPLPDFHDWELKSQRSNTTSLLTLFHTEPGPREARVVPNVLLPRYGWPHEEAGKKYPPSEKSFRQTISGDKYSDRGFTVTVDYNNGIVLVDFDFDKISTVSHAKWKQSIAEHENQILTIKPYWTFSDIDSKLKTKLKNTMYIKADRTEKNGEEYFRYNQFEIFTEPSLEKFLSQIKLGNVYIDFDARTGHNHGTKFRISQNSINQIYAVHARV